MGCRGCRSLLELAGVLIARLGRGRSGGLSSGRASQLIRTRPHPDLKVGLGSIRDSLTQTQAQHHPDSSHNLSKTGATVSAIHLSHGLRQTGTHSDKGLSLTQKGALTLPGH